MQPSQWLLDCRFAEENAAGLALGALNDEEEQRISRHLSWCPTCARLMHETRKTISYLPFLSLQANPPISAKIGLFERIATDARSLTTPSDAEGPLAELLRNPPGGVIASDLAPAKAASPKRFFNWEMVAAPLAAVPLVFALAIVGGWALHTQSRLDRQSAQAAVLRTENTKMEAQIAVLNNVLDSPTKNYVLDSPDSVTGSDAVGKLVASPIQNWASLSVWNLQPSASYEVLVENQDGTLENAGLVTVDSKGSGHIDLHIIHTATEYQAIHVQRLVSTNGSAATNHVDVLWTDMDGTLGASGDTEANAKSH